MIHTILLLAGILAPHIAPAKPSAPDRPPPRAAVQAAARDAEAPPTPAEIRRHIDAGNGAEALRLVSRLLALRGKQAQTLDRHELLVLKAEAHLRNRSANAAALAFKQAAKETSDREKAAVARCTELLIRRSRNLAYTPKHPPGGNGAAPAEIDIVAPKTRQLALQALLADEMAELADRVKAAKATRTLPPALKAMQAARELATLELAANGSADQVNGIVEELKQSKKDLLGKIMEKTTRRVDQIAEMANDKEPVRQVLPDGYGGFNIAIVDRRRGIRGQDVVVLKALADTCDEVAAGARAVAEASGSDEAEVEDLVNDAEDLRMHIRRMLRSHDIEY